MREISAASNVPISTLYYHITSKQILLRDLSLDAIVRITERVKGAIAEVPVGSSNVYVMIRVHVEAMIEDRYMHAIALTELRSLDEDARRVVVSARDTYESLVLEAIKRAQEDCVVRCDISAHTLTLLLLNLLNWTIFWYREDGELSADELTRAIYEVFMEGAMMPSICA